MTKEISGHITFENLKIISNNGRHVKGIDVVAEITMTRRIYRGWFKKDGYETKTILIHRHVCWWSVVETGLPFSIELSYDIDRMLHNQTILQDVRDEYNIKLKQDTNEKKFSNFQVKGDRIGSVDMVETTGFWWFKKVTVSKML